MARSSQVSRRLVRWLPLTILTACVVGDPGWVYTVRGATPVEDGGRRFDIAGPEGLKLRIYADAFTGSLDTEVEVIGSTRPLPDTTRLAVTIIDKFGRSLPPHRSRPSSSECQAGGRTDSGFPADTIVCSASTTAAIHPITGCSRNPDLDEITIKITGLGEGFPPEVRVQAVAE
jgi:hypothetical protein